MLGSLRFILALAVAFSHMGLTPNFHVGAMAVVIFYMIAGYVMTHSFKRNFAGSLRNIGGFYADRFLRIYPLYIVSLLMVLAVALPLNYGKLYLDPYSIFVNLTVLVGNVHPTLINPPAWSLATEFQFYLLFPFIFCFPRLKYLLLALSYVVFCLASFGRIPPIEWGYKYLPGTLCMFILGSVMYDIHASESRTAWKLVIGAVAACTMQLALLSRRAADIDHPYAFESLCGILAGIVCILMLADSKPRYRHIDEWLGKLSYPLFLSHVCVLYFFDDLRIDGVYAPSARGVAAMQLIASVLVSVPLALLDERFQQLRKRVQAAGARKAQGAVAAVRRAA